MHVTIKKDSPNCDCGTAWVLEGDWYRCPNCQAFRDKNNILAIAKNEKKKKKT